MNKMCRTNAQSGRSMIEMLGVLAIIGVLSVGGIAGYSKAMTKYRINKTIDQFTQISQNVRMLYGKQRQKNYRNLNGRILYKANLAPKEMFIEGTSYYMMNAWGEEFKVAPISYSATFGLATLIPSEEACIELATQDWGSRDTTGLNSVTVVSAIGTDTDSFWENCSGERGNGYAVACSGGSKVSTPMPVDVAADVCENGMNVVMLVFQ